MSELALAVGRVAPLYNLALVTIAVYLFWELFTMRAKNKKVFFTPWKLVFLSVSIFIIEQAVTVLRQAQILNIPIHINGFFELAIISVFIYALLLQKEHVRKEYS